MSAQPVPEHQNGRNPAVRAIDRQLTTAAIDAMDIGRARQILAFVTATTTDPWDLLYGAPFDVVRDALLECPEAPDFDDVTYTVVPPEDRPEAAAAARRPSMRVSARA